MAALGRDETQYMRKMVTDWSLPMVFSERNVNVFFADVNSYH